MYHVSCCLFVFFKQKTAYEMRISDWSSDVCSSDLVEARGEALMFGLLHPLQGFVDGAAHHEDLAHHPHRGAHRLPHERFARARDQAAQRSRPPLARSEEHTSEPQQLMRTS